METFKRKRHKMIILNKKYKKYFTSYTIYSIRKQIINKNNYIDFENGTLKTSDFVDNIIYDLMDLFIKYKKALKINDKDLLIIINEVKKGINDFIELNANLRGNIDGYDFFKHYNEIYEIYKGLKIIKNNKIMKILLKEFTEKKYNNYLLNLDDSDDGNFIKETMLDFDKEFKDVIYFIYKDTLNYLVNDQDLYDIDKEFKKSLFDIFINDDDDYIFIFDILKTLEV